MIRAGSAADAAQIAEVQRESWSGAYTGIIADEIIDRVTALDDGARVRQSFRTRPWQRMIVAIPDGEERRVAELYALYVRPAWWSTGTGRTLMDRVLARSAAAGYSSLTLWVLRDNRRARRFYERAWFAPDGATNVLTGLGDVLELRYRRQL